MILVKKYYFNIFIIEIGFFKKENEELLKGFKF
jgi:hypothetical protein